MFLAILGSVALLWLKRGFTARGRLSMTTLYAVFAVLALTSLLQSGAGGQFSAASNARMNTVAPILYGGTQDTPAPTFAVPALTDDAEDEQAERQSVASNSGIRNGNSACEQVLVRFLECWQGGMVSDMVELTAKSWQQKASFLTNGAEQALYAQISGKKLESFTLDGEPTGTDNDTSRTINLLCNVIVKDEPRLIRYQALILREDNKWLVDPNSLMSGTRVDAATPGPGQVGFGESATEQPTATPKPTAKPKSNLKLYYNPKGGEYYHAEAKCSAVNKRYYPLKSFTYGAIHKSPQKNLSPCPSCNPPPRP